MNEKDIKTLAHVYALVANMNAILVESVGMAAENTFNQLNGENILFGSDEFVEQVAKLKAVALELTRISDGDIR